MAETEKDTTDNQRPRWTLPEILALLGLVVAGVLGWRDTLATVQAEGAIMRVKLSSLTEAFDRYASSSDATRAMLLAAQEKRDDQQDHKLGEMDALVRDERERLKLLENRVPERRR